MNKKTTKKIFAILAILLFIGPLLFTAFANTSNYLSSKKATPVTTEQKTNEDQTTTSDK